MHDDAPWAFRNVVDALKAVYPHGHPSYLKFLLEDAALHSSKNRDYALGGTPLGNFERVALLLRNYPNFPFDTPEGVAFLYLFKQLDAVLWHLCQGHSMNEGVLDRLRDVSIYSVIIRCIIEERDKID